MTPGGSDGESVEIRIEERDYKDLRALDRSDLAFALFYGSLLVWGVLLTLLAIG